MYEPRRWQKPLTDDDIRWCVEQFELARRRIQLIWESPRPTFRDGRWQ